MQSLEPVLNTVHRKDSAALVSVLVWTVSMVKIVPACSISIIINVSKTVLRDSLVIQLIMNAKSVIQTVGIA